jgi:ribonucleoside-diphosphate reductase alpha chain
MGMNTTGIEPAFSLVSYKSMVGGGYMKLVNSMVPQALAGLGYSEQEIKAISEHIETTDCIEGAPGLKAEHLPVFDCAMPSGPSGRFLSPESHIKMMAAIQPLITCAQSKTVNLPNNATIEDIENIYMMAWRMGVKCVALYRDGCKASQPLAAKKEEKKAEPVAVNPIQESMFEASDEPAEATRNRLPDDINGHRHRFEINGFKGYIVVNEYDDGRPGEVFLKLGKPGSTISGLIDGFTQLLSIALQYGVPLPKLINSFIDTSFEPSGMTSNKKIRFTKSIYDYLFKYLDVKYEGGTNSGLAERIAMIEEAEAKKPKQAMSTRKISAIKGLAEKNAETKPRKSLSTPPCNRCGNFTQKNGSCYVCTSCGTTTGCS